MSNINVRLFGLPENVGKNLDCEYCGKPDCEIAYIVQIPGGDMFPLHKACHEAFLESIQEDDDT